MPLDLASVDSVLSCAQEVRKRYPYLTHVMLNAGSVSLYRSSVKLMSVRCGPFTGIDWLGAVKQTCTNFLDALTRPTFTLERLGQMTEDGLG